MSRMIAAFVLGLCLGASFVVIGDGGNAPPREVPRTFTITLPTADLDDEEWRATCWEASSSLAAIADAYLAIVEDDRHSIRRRVNALNVANDFAPIWNTRRLIGIIDLEDDRGVSLAGDWGWEPVKNILISDGSRFLHEILSALAYETDPHRRALLCDVLSSRAVLGIDATIYVLREYAEADWRSTEERQNVNLAIAELESRQAEAQ